jgi:hypothetical protein
MSYPIERTKLINVSFELTSEVDACEGGDWAEDELEQLAALLETTVRQWAKTTRFSFFEFFELGEG